MPRFFLLDHSLKGIGGHHFDYALHVLGAATRLGFETVVASNRKFRGQAELPSGSRVFPLFRYHTYNRYTLFCGDRHRLVDPQHKPPHPGDGTQRWNLTNFCAALRTQWREFKELKHRNGPQRRKRDLAEGCTKLFTRVPLAAGDHVFVPTLSELDLLGLVEFWESSPQSQYADWHLQFHFNFLDGREPEFSEQQHRVEQMGKLFGDALARVPHHRLHCYNTSHELTRQYNLLGVADFQNLAYPINPSFYTGKSGRVAPGPLRVTCAGGIREEKGQSGLESLVDTLWNDYLAPGKLQLVVQTGKKKLSTHPKFQVFLPTPSSVPPKVRLPREVCDDPVAYIRHPLGLKDYADLVSRADIGLLLYDSRRYYTRRAGVMGELLAAGVPVIVPAGCWLAEQISEPIFRHQLKLESQLPVVGRIAPSEMTWQCAAGEGSRANTAGTRILCGDETSAAQTVLNVPDESRELLTSFEWMPDAEAGEYVKLSAEFVAADGGALGRFDAIVGQRNSGDAVPALFHLPAGAARVRLTCRNAYHYRPLGLRKFGATWLGASGEGAYCPSGAVGLIAADAKQAATLVREMCDHYDHYRRTAEAFSHGWFAAHDPLRTVEQLTKAHASRLRATRAA